MQQVVGIDRPVVSEVPSEELALPAAQLWLHLTNII